MDTFMGAWTDPENDAKYKDDDPKNREFVNYWALIIPRNSNE
jgi:hypothetical protein